MVSMKTQVFQVQLMVTKIQEDIFKVLIKFKKELTIRPEKLKLEFHPQEKFELVNNS